MCFRKKFQTDTWLTWLGHYFWIISKLILKIVLSGLYHFEFNGWRWLSFQISLPDKLVSAKNLTSSGSSRRPHNVHYHLSIAFHPLKLDHKYSWQNAWRYGHLFQKSDGVVPLGVWRNNWLRMHSNSFSVDLILLSCPLSDKSWSMRRILLTSLSKRRFREDSSKVPRALTPSKFSISTSNYALTLREGQNRKHLAFLTRSRTLGLWHSITIRIFWLHHGFWLKHPQHDATSSVSKVLIHLCACDFRKYYCKEKQDKRITLANMARDFIFLLF